MIKTINKKNYQVLSTEFESVPHERYNCLNLIPEVGEKERLVSLIRETAISLNIKNVVHVSPSHGAFIPIQLVQPHINESNDSYSEEHDENTIENVFIHSLEPQHIENTFANIYNCPNIYVSSLLPYEPCVIFLESEDGATMELVNRQLFESKGGHVVLSKIYADGFRLSRTDWWLSIPPALKDDFLKDFHYYVEENGVLNYDNLIHLCIMVKNGGDSFERMLTENMHWIDRWTILDTGSTDNTIETIHRVLTGKKRGQLFQEPFISFPDSRNRCLELAGQTCKYTLMLDDTYIVEGGLREFLEMVRGDQFASSYSLYIKSHDVQYTSNRIVKTENKLRYIYKLHEVINPENNINVTVPYDVANIYDIRTDFMELRTMDRKPYDLQVLEEGLREEPDNPRNLYYLAHTYNLMKQYDVAYDYFLQRINHQVEGFIQEKHDACFEAGRIAHFQLGKPCEEYIGLYERAYALDNKRPESQYFIGIHYYLGGNYSLAWNYFVRAYEIGFPVHCEFSLKPTLSYYFLPKYLAELCYTFAKNYTFGKQVAQFFLQNNRPNDTSGNMVADYTTMQLWFNIFSLLETTKPHLLQPKDPHEKPILAFVADGGFGSWTGRDILSKGIGGSETYIIEMARNIQRKGVFQVVVFCRCEEMDIFENVFFYPLEQYTSYISVNRVHTSIVSRYTEYVPCSIEGNVDNVCIVLHDLVQDGTVIPLHNKIKKVFCLSEWHVEHFSNMFPQFREKTVPLYYGVAWDTKPDAPVPSIVPSIVPYKFIYSSFPNRGLLPLLQMWKRIVSREPRASLHIYSNVDGEWVNRVAGEDMQKIRILLKELASSNVHCHGWVSKKTLMESWMTADVWFYPTTFLETFCLTALECAVSKTLAITMNMGALQNTVADRGILLEGNPLDELWQTRTVETLFYVLSNSVLKKDCIERNYQWAKNLSWDNQSDQLMHYLRTE